MPVDENVQPSSSGSVITGGVSGDKVKGKEREGTGGRSGAGVEGVEFAYDYVQVSQVS